MSCGSDRSLGLVALLFAQEDKVETDFTCNIAKPMRDAAVLCKALVRHRVSLKYNETMLWDVDKVIAISGSNEETDHGQ